MANRDQFREMCFISALAGTGASGLARERVVANAEVIANNAAKVWDSWQAQQLPAAGVSPPQESEARRGPGRPPKQAPSPAPVPPNVQIVSEGPPK